MVQTACLQGLITSFFRGMSGKDHLVPGYTAVPEVVKSGKGMAFVQVIDICAPQGFHEFGPANAQDNVLGNTGVVVGVV